MYIYMIPHICEQSMNKYGIWIIMAKNFTTVVFFGGFTVAK